MSENSAIGHGGSDPHDGEDSVDVSSHREGGGSVRASQIPEPEPHAPGANEGNAGANVDPATFMANFLNLLGQAAPNVAPTPPRKRDPVLELKKMGAEKFYGDRADPELAENWLVSTAQFVPFDFSGYPSRVISHFKDRSRALVDI